MPAPGTTVDSRNDPSMDSAFYSSLTAGSGGPMNWDFTSRVYGSTFSQLSVSTVSTPDIDSFPGANLVLLTDLGPDTAWSIMKSLPNVFWLLGIVSRSTFGDMVIVYKDTAADAVFPVALGNQWTSFRHWSQVTGTFHTDISDTTHYTVDAWGTAQHGSKSIPCLRVISHENIINQTFNGNVLINTLQSDMFTVSFVASGYSILTSATKSVFSGNATYNGSASADFLKSPTDVAEGSGTLPTQFDLAQNYPNPFNPTTTIQYTLPTRSPVKLEIYNVAGQLVRRLADNDQSAGTYSITWDGTSTSGDPVSTGVYLYRFQAGNFVDTKKMLLLK